MSSQNNDLLEKFEAAKIKVVEVEVHIYQPRAQEGSIPKEPVILQAEDLIKNYYPLIMERIKLYEGWVKQEEIPEEDFERNQVVGEHCQFCTGKTLCRPFTERKMGNTIELFKKALSYKVNSNGADKKKSLTVSEIAKVKIEKPDINLMLKKGMITPEEFSFIALNSSAIISFVELFRPVAIQVLGTGKPHPFKQFIKLIKTAGPRSLIPDKLKLKKGLIALGISNPIKMVEKWMTITDIETEIGKGKIEHLTNPGEDRFKVVEFDDSTPSVKFGIDTKEMFKDSILKRKEVKVIEKNV